MGVRIRQQTLSRSIATEPKDRPTPRHGSNRRTACRCLFLFWLVAVPVLVEIPGLVTWMIMMLARHFLLAGLIAVTVLIDIPRLVAWMIVMFARFFLRHVILLGCDVRNGNAPIAPLFPGLV